MIGKIFSLIMVGTIALFFTGENSFAAFFQDSFESGNLSHAENGFLWSSSVKTTVTTDIAHTGSKSLKFTYAGGAAGTDSFAEQRFVLGQQLSEVYVRWYQYFPDGTEGLGPKWVQRNESPGNNKWFRIWDDDYNAYNIKGGMSTMPSGSTGDSTVGMEYNEQDNGSPGVGVGFFANGQTTAITAARRGRWVCVEVRAKASTSQTASDGLLELWLDGVKVRSNTGLLWWGGTTHNYFKNGYLMGWANTGHSSTSYTYIDDVVISNTYIGPSNTSLTVNTINTMPSPPTNLNVN